MGKLFKKKVINGLCCLTGMCFLLSGCGKKVDYEDVKEENGEYQDVPLGQELGVPETCEYDFSLDDSSTLDMAEIDTDNIKLPQTDHMDTVTYNLRKCDEEYKKSIAEGIFDAGSVYIYDSQYPCIEDINAIKDYYNEKKEQWEKAGNQDMVSYFENMMIIVEIHTWEL
jgi:hypothetical protein